MMVKVELQGYVCDGPMSGLTVTTNNQARLRFTLLVEDDTGGDYHDIVVRGPLALRSSQYLQRGQQISVEGRLRERRYEGRTGNQYIATEVVAKKVIFGVDGSGRPS